MNEAISQFINGILVVQTKTENSTKTVRYIDSSRGLILDVLEQTADKKIFTKYESNGIQPKTIEISTKNETILYQKDAKTPISITKTTDDNIIENTTFRLDGKTIEKIKTETPQGTTQTIYYNEDGLTPLKLIETDIDGLSKTTFYDAYGKGITSIQEDMADGSILKTFYRLDGTVEKKQQSHIKGFKKNQIRQTFFDKSGKNKISIEDVFLISDN